MITNIAGADLAATEKQLRLIGKDYHTIEGTRYARNYTMANKAAAVVVHNEGPVGSQLLLEKIVIYSDVASLVNLGYMSDTDSWIAYNFGINLRPDLEDSVRGQLWVYLNYVFTDYWHVYSTEAGKILVLDVGGIGLESGWGAGISITTTGNHKVNFIWREVS